MSNEQPRVREIIPYKSGKRPSTFRKLNIDFAGTALEQALAQREQANLNDAFSAGDSSDETISVLRAAVRNSSASS